MTETLTNPETSTEDVPVPERPVSELSGHLRRWEETPPPSLSAALAEAGVAVEALEELARSGGSSEEVERLRKVLVQGATSGQAEDAALLARLLPVLDPRERAWDRLIRARQSGEILTATVTEAVKGGVVVDLGVRGFVPSSQLGLNVPRNLTQFVGRPLRLRVKEVDRRRQTVILSNREIAEEERAEKRRAAIDRLEDGEVRTGTVRRLTDIGAFVDVGGVDGLLHVSEIAWRRVEKPSDVLNVGDKIQVKVLRVDPEAGRVSLSIRRLTQDPWEEVRRKYQVGTSHPVKISRTIAQGAIIELDGGLEGFLPISELAPRRVATVEEVVQVGQDVEALVIDVVPRDRRVVFSLRKLEQKKERAVVDNYQKKARTQTQGERVTLGDLFGHLFEEFQTEDEKPASATTTEGDAVREAAVEAAPAVAEDIPSDIVPVEDVPHDIMPVEDQPTDIVPVEEQPDDIVPVAQDQSGDAVEQPADDAGTSAGDEPVEPEVSPQDDAATEDAPAEEPSDEEGQSPATE
jgi:small subunit ribosomal protein S1